MPDKLDELKSKIGDAQAKDKTPAAAEPSQDAENMSTGIRAGTELVGAILGCALIGYGLDVWLDTKPLFLIGLLILGVATGFYNVYRITGR